MVMISADVILSRLINASGGVPAAVDGGLSKFLYYIVLLNHSAFLEAFEVQHRNIQA